MTWKLDQKITTKSVRTKQAFIEVVAKMAE